jgi:predicted phosphodiesterase
MMKLQYASDLHLEFAENSSFLKHHPMGVEGDILVLAGDIGYIGDDNINKHPFWDWASDNYKSVIVIPGNHEFYKFFDIDQLHNGWTYAIRKNVTYHYNASIQLTEHTVLLATTLWSKIDVINAYATERAISDFYRIRSGESNINWVRFNEEHERCLAFLKASIAASKSKHIIVASHHVPSFKLLANEFIDSPYNGAFTVELGNLIASSPIDYWIYGHSHRNLDAQIVNTQCLTNQLGYVSHNEHRTFNGGKTIEIE